MIQVSKAVVLTVLVLGLSSEVFAKRNNRGWDRGNGRDNGSYSGGSNNRGSNNGSYNDSNNKEEANIPSVDQQAQSGDDVQIVNAMNSRKRTRFVEGKNLKVVQLLPDDNSGSRHQKFVVELSNNKTIQIISNLDMCPAVPVRVGDEVAVGGEFIPTGNSGLVHWVHWDPRGDRPDGYIEYNGQVYCKKN